MPGGCSYSKFRRDCFGDGAECHARTFGGQDRRVDHDDVRHREEGGDAGDCFSP